MYDKVHFAKSIYISKLYMVFLRKCMNMIHNTQKKKTVLIKPSSFFAISCDLSLFFFTSDCEGDKDKKQLSIKGIFIITYTVLNVNYFQKKLLRNPKTINPFLCAVPNIFAYPVSTSSQMPINSNNQNVITVFFCYLFNCLAVLWEHHPIPQRIFKQMMVTANT